MVMSSQLTYSWETSIGQIKGKMRPSPPLQLKFRGTHLKLGTGSPNSFPSKRNKGYLKTTCSMEAGKALGIASNIALLMFPYMTCNSLRNAESLKRRGRLVKPKPLLRWRWRQQQLHYPHKGWWVVKTTQISTTSSRCLSGTSERLSSSGKSHTTLLKGGQDWGPLLWERGLWERNFGYRWRRLLEERPVLSARSHSPV